MFGLEILFIPLLIIYVFSGPIALIVVCNLLGKVKRLSRKIESLEADTDTGKPLEPLFKPMPRTVAVEPVDLPQDQTPAAASPEPVASEPQTPPPSTAELLKEMPPIQTRHVPEPVKQKRPEKSEISMEQKIGTQWVLIAGIITVMVGVGFFLKYAYDNFGLTPLVRVIIVAVAGLGCLITGEVTRRRSYEIVAKGVTALGFALLYASVFAAYQMYDLIGMLPAFICAVGITVAAMLYAAVLDEILIAFISLLGGFGAAGLVVNTVINPSRLFIYIVMFSVGAMAVGTYRKWRPINFLTFIGSYIIYGMWYHYSYDPFELMPAAVFWLSVFFAFYLVMPVIYEIVRKTNTKIEDVLLVFFNSAAAFCIFLIIYEDAPKSRIGLVCVCFAIANFIMTSVVIFRNREDDNLKIVFTALTIFFVTLAIPLYLGANWLTIVWIMEGLMLAVIGLCYRSKFVQVVSAIPFLLSIGNLTTFLPMHIGDFQPVLNSMFGMWMLMSTALLIYHLMFRLSGRLNEKNRPIVSELTYVLFGAVFFFTVISEWFYYADWNFAGTESIRLHFAFGMIVISIVIMLMFAVKPVSPGGNLSGVVTLSAAIAASVCSILALSFYPHDFWLFANINFAFAFLAVLGLLAIGWLINITSGYYDSQSMILQIPPVFVVWSVLLLLVQITMHIWYYFDEMVIAGYVIAHMWISIAWAIYGSILIIIGFAAGWKSLRYIALGLFAVMLIKVFIVDTKNIGSLYRIAAFLATGATLVAMSYLYQHLKKKGFFDKLSTADKNLE